MKDHSWGVVGTTVLEVRHGGARYIVKAGDERDHHIARELRAHRTWLEPLTSRRRAPSLLHGDEVAKVLVTHHLPGELVQGDDERRPELYRQAGELLARLHGGCAVEDEQFEVRAKEKTLGLLAGPHRIRANVAARLREEVESWPTPTVTVVPTHGDWQPRNWLVHEGRVRVIDFGRADLRPAMTDLTRLAAQQFQDTPATEPAFLDGYGSDPREPAAWRRNRLREAIGTAVWAFDTGQESFEQQGHRMIDEALRP